MSTNARIIVEVPTTMYGKKMVKCYSTFEKNTGYELGAVCGRELLHLKSTKRLQLDSKYVSIYHHWDGYPEDLGKELLKHYNNIESAIALMCLGDCSTIIGKIVPYRLSGEKDCDTFHYNSLSEVPTNQYTYLFSNGKWYVKEYKDEWEELDDVIVY